MMEAILELREILTTLEQYIRLHYKTFVHTLYVPANGTAIGYIPIPAVLPGYAVLNIDVGFWSSVTCVSFVVNVDGNVYAQEPCWQPNLYSWGINFYKDGMIVIAKNFIYYEVNNSTNTDAIVKIREGYVAIPIEELNKLEEKYYRVIKQVIE